MKNLFNTIFLCALLALAPAAFSGRDGGYAAFAQNNVTVTGTVVDELGEPLLGAGIGIRWRSPSARTASSGPSR